LNAHSLVYTTIQKVVHHLLLQWFYSPKINAQFKSSQPCSWEAAVNLTAVSYPVVTTCFDVKKRGSLLAS
jgi:hypothetical protein